MKTSKDYTLTFKHYGEITVPAGTLLTNKTAMGIDPKYHFVDDMRWIDTNYADIANILKDDVAYSGINVPLEYIEQEIVPPVSANEVVEAKIPALDSYYSQQLARVGNPRSEYAPTFQIRHGDTGHTNWISLSDESAQALVNWLGQHYNISK